MITAVVVEDEMKARDALLKMISENCPDIEVVGVAASSTDAYDLITQNEPALLFLDIEISNERSPETSFDLLGRLKKRDFEVIFVTAFDKYAVKAFQFSAIGYLLKPFGIDELVAAVDRAVLNLKNKSLNSRLEDLLGQVQVKTTHRNRIWIHSQNEIVPILLDEIIFLEAQGKYTLFRCKGDKQILSSKNLGAFADMLEDNGFLKVHRSYIVNPHMISKFDKTDGGSLVMQGGTYLPVSKSARKKLLGMD